MFPSFAPAKQKESYKINYKTICKKIAKTMKTKKRKENLALNLKRKNKKRKPSSNYFRP
jgi:hypothetical protein